MLYTCSASTAKTKAKEMKQYSVELNHGNDEVAPDKQDIDLFKSGDITAKGFALNYQVKLRRREADEWMARVSKEAIHEDIVLVGGEEEAHKMARTILAEMMMSMFGGKMNFRYEGEL